MEDAKWEPTSEDFDKSLHETNLAALNTAVFGEDKAIEEVVKCNFIVKKDTYHDAVTEHKQKQRGLQNAGWNMLNLPVDYSTLHSKATYACDQIVSNQYLLI